MKRAKSGNLKTWFSIVEMEAINSPKESQKSENHHQKL